MNRFQEILIKSVHEVKKNQNILQEKIQMKNTNPEGLVALELSNHTKGFWKGNKNESQ